MWRADGEDPAREGQTLAPHQAETHCSRMNDCFKASGATERIQCKGLKLGPAQNSLRAGCMRPAQVGSPSRVAGSGSEMMALQVGGPALAPPVTLAGLCPILKV